MEVLLCIECHGMNYMDDVTVTTRGGQLHVFGRELSVGPWHCSIPGKEGLLPDT